MRRDPRKKYLWVIGIDPGVETGMCVWDCFGKRIRQVATVKIHVAMAGVKFWHDSYPDGVLVRVEDARKRKWFDGAGREKLQGAGSIKRDSKIWDDYLQDLGVAYEMVAPADNKTKLDSKRFAMVTKHTGKTSEHARDATMLVFGI
jgi:hypothetical protein